MTRSQLKYNWHAIYPDTVEGGPSIADLRAMKARQSLKIQGVADALAEAGFVDLDEQAHALGLARSTMWTILQGHHKASGLSGAVIARILRTPELPPIVRARILEYVSEKIAGMYGHNARQVRRFLTSFKAAQFIADKSERYSKDNSSRYASDVRPTKTRPNI